jgi:hypothetical protein
VPFILLHITKLLGQRKKSLFLLQAMSELSEDDDEDDQTGIKR